MTIDAGVHFWKYGKNTNAPLIRDNKILKEDFLPENLALNFKRNGVDACLAVAAEPAEVETRFLSELALTHREILGVIGWIPLDDPKAAEKMDGLSAYTAIKAFKTMLPGDLSTLQPVMESLARHGYALDIALSHDTDAGTCSHWMQTFPDQVFVLENGGNPDVRKTLDPAWVARIKRLSENPNLYCKLSGFFTSSNWKSWKPADFYPFLDVLTQAFGGSRLLFASNWPYLLLSGSYVQWKSLLEKYTERFNETEKEGFFGVNARRAYRL